jgi:hypothetical protein
LQRLALFSLCGTQVSPYPAYIATDNAKGATIILIFGILSTADDTVAILVHAA